MSDPAVDRVSSVAPVAVNGVFYRHAAPNRDAFAGGLGGRWGASFPVIYLGRPEAAAVAEAYRHLVDDTGVPAHAVRPRILYTVRIAARTILDLTVAANLSRVELTSADLTTEIGDYERCQAVAAVAHALGLHGVLALASHGLGQTLALFLDHLPPDEAPVVVREEQWIHLPPDPRHVWRSR